MKKFYFELKIEQAIYADSEDEARRHLKELGTFECDFELVNVEALKDALAKDKNVSR